MALVDDKLFVGKNHAQNGEWIDITMRKINILLSMDEDADWQNYLKYINIDLKFVEEKRLSLLSKYNKIVFELNKCRDELLILKQAKLDAVTFQIQNTELTRLNHALQEHLKEEKKINEKWLTSSKKVSQCISEQIPHQKKKVLSGELFTESSSKMNENENHFIPASMVPESQAVNESFKPTKTLTNPESLKDSEAESLTPLPPLKTLQGASPSSKILKAKAKPFPSCTHCGFNDHRPDDYRNYPECEISGSYDHFTSGHNRVIHVRGGVLSSESLIGVKCNTCGSIRHIMEPIWYLDSGCSRNMTGVKSYLHKYVEQRGPKVVFSDNSSCITEGYGSINCGGIIFNANKEILLIAHRRNDVYVLDMSSLTPNGSCFFAKASESVNWLWHKRLSHLNFKNINKLAKQNKVLGLPLLVYSKDKPCSACEKGKHKRASFKTKQNFSIRKCLYLLLHMDLFGPISPMSINHEKYTLVIVDEYSRTDNGTEYRNTELESFCDEKGISQNFSSSYTPEQNGVAERKNRTPIEATRTMLNGSILSKHF
ncbi:retrovirus-related pol polyprotein from transposon TNT 1-94 [Tanacetum coccineum]|uniref:Retrovirus-related pol polyprotein from transposon TNT 1-94 n=1 Tax=Tanacetum coccineum TaxID=301880 RepID=A0ABQ5F1M2_9ASTR